MGKKFNKKGIEVDETALDASEQEAEVAEVAEEAIEELVDFEHWYGQRQNHIPNHHHKEIIKADFKGRKVPEMATMAQFDEALKKYGIKLV